MRALLGFWASHRAELMALVAQHVLRGMGLSHLSKNKQALNELKDKGMAPI